MEAYADGLVKFLLEFMRFLVTRVSGILMSWYDSGFLEWVAKHWLALVIVLVVAGILVDQVVWFMRWRPYYSWMRTWRKLVNGFRQLGRKVKDPSYRAGTQEQFSAQREEVLRKLALQDGKAGGVSMSAGGVNGFGAGGANGHGAGGANGYGAGASGGAKSTARAGGSGGEGGEVRTPVSAARRQQGIRPGAPAQGNRSGQAQSQGNPSGQPAPRSPSYGRPSGKRDDRGRE